MMKMSVCLRKSVRKGLSEEASLPFSATTPKPMKSSILHRSKVVAVSLATAAFSFAALQNASALIVGPYTVDTNTLHLYHLNDSTTPVIDSVATGTNLQGLLNGATLLNPSYTGFGTALNTVDGGPDGIAAANKDALLSAPASAGVGPFTYANATNGAFTYEAVVWIGFDPTKNFGTTTVGGNGRNTTFEIMSIEGGSGTRIFQFRILPTGVAPGGTGNPATAPSPLLTFENIASSPTMFATIPTNGPDAIASNNWYHVAVTYNGVPNTANNIKFYWTLMDPTRNAANQIPITSARLNNANLSPLSSAGSCSFLIGNENRNRAGNFMGQIDEVRISGVERTAAQMMFISSNVTIISSPANQFVAVGDSVSLNVLATGQGTLGYQWQLNSNNISPLSNPTATNATLVINNIGTNQAGNYQVVVTNTFSGATSQVATVTVGGLFTDVFNTGLDSHRALLAGGTVDPHWQLNQSADPAYPGPNAYVITAPLGNYATNGPNSQWITPGDGANIAAGTFVYRTTFLLDTVDPTHAQLTGSWSSDNQGLNMILNGTNMNITNPGATTSLTPFTITNGFVAGFNTLDCVITNLAGGGNNPSAIRVEARGIGNFLPPTAPSIVQSPTNITTNTQQSASFSVAAIGSAPLTYQWYGPSMTPLGGQTNRTLTLTSLTTGQSGTYTVIVSNTISTATANASLSVVAPPSLTWVGLNSGDWDTTTTNWLDNGSLQNTLFAQFDDVIFDSNGSGQPTVNLTTALSPNSITINAGNDYTFSGVGSLTGSMNLTKTNTGTLVVDTVNSFNGQTTISGGTIQIGNNDANGSLGSGAISNNGALTFTRTDTFFVPNIISGSGSVTMNGTGNALLAGNNSYSGSTTINSGILTARSPSALGTGASPTTVGSSAELNIDLNINIGNQPLILGGTGPGGVGALHKGGAGTSIYGGSISLTAYSGIGVDANSTLILTNSSAITSTDQNLAAQVGSAGFLIVNGTVSLGAGTVQEFGSAGTWTFTATNNSWTGTTTINSGNTMQIGDGGADGSIGSGSIDVEGTLTFNSALNLNVNNTITGGGTVIASGTGVVTLNGTNTHSATKVSGSGILHIGNNQALGSGTLTVGASQTDIGRVELTGGQTIGNQVAIFPRAFGTLNNPANFVNLSGTNIIASPGAIQIAAGGNLLTFESDSGLLSVQSEITAAGVLRDLVLKGTASGQVLNPIDATAGNSVLIWKLDSGTWTLAGANTPGAGTTISNGTLIITGSMDTNTVTVAGGTLSGTGTFAGSVAVSTGGTISPGPGIGTMTISSNLTLSAGSFTVMDINKTSATNDLLTGMSNAIYAGTLTVNNQSGTLASGDVFKLFSASNYSGSFSSYSLPALGGGLSWSTSSLLVDGTLRVTNATTPPTITSVVVSSGNLVFSGSGGPPSGSYVVLTSTNVAAPLISWTHASTNSYDGTGHFSVTNAIVPGVTREFFRLLNQ